MTPVAASHLGVAVMGLLVLQTLITGSYSSTTSNVPSKLQTERFLHSPPTTKTLFSIIPVLAPLRCVGIGAFDAQVSVLGSYTSTTLRSLSGLLKSRPPIT